jgi:hypothetical protein
MWRSSSTCQRKRPPDFNARRAGSRFSVGPPLRPTGSWFRFRASGIGTEWRNNGPGRGQKQREPCLGAGSGAGDCGGEGRSGGRAHMSELLGGTGRGALQADLPAMRLLPKLFGLLLIFFNRGEPKPHPNHSDLWANTGESGGDRFLSFPCLGRGRSTTMSGPPRALACFASSQNSSRTEVRSE